jgi:ABC-2 type transport system permease protein
MTFSWRRALIIARREYLTAVRKKAFLFTLIGMPAYIAFIISMSVKPQVDDALKSLRDTRTVGVVDSSGLFTDPTREIRTTFSADVNPFETKPDTTGPRTFVAAVRLFPAQAAAEEALRSHAVDQVLVIPPDYLETGALRRYSRGGGGFSSASERPITGWLVRNLLADRVDSARIERVARPSRGLVTYELGKDGAFTLKDDRRELLSLMLPLVFGMLMGISIVTGGQYLLQGVSEEKESRILESLICTVTAEDLLVGKMLGLGSVGLTLVAAWAASGAALGGPAAILAQAHLPVSLGVLLFVFFALGYLFYASLMIAVGAMTNSMREAQQVAWAFTFANFVPFIAMMPIISHPDGPLAVALSFLPFTAATTTVMRLAVPGSAVPAWQLAGTIAVLVASVWLVLSAAARIFRIGLLMYGKTPTLPEILRWARTK